MSVQINKQGVAVTIIYRSTPSTAGKDIATLQVLVFTMWSRNWIYIQFEFWCRLTLKTMTFSHQTKGSYCANLLRSGLHPACVCILCQFVLKRISCYFDPIWSIRFRHFLTVKDYKLKDTCSHYQVYQKKILKLIAVFLSIRCNTMMTCPDKQRIGRVKDSHNAKHFPACTPGTGGRAPIHSYDGCSVVHEAEESSALWDQ